MKLARHPALLVAALVWAGCGVTAPWDSSPGQPVRRDLGFSPAVLSFEGEVGLDAPPRQVVFLAGTGAFSVWPEASWPVASVDVDGPNSFEVSVEPPDVVGAGVFEGAIRFETCHPNSSCAETDVATPSLRVRYVVSPPSLSVAPAELWFEQVARGPLPDDQQLRVGGPTGGAPWTATVDYGYALPEWLALSPSSGDSIPASITVGVHGTPGAPWSGAARIVITRGGRQETVPAHVAVRAPSSAVTSEPLAFSVRAGETVRSAPDVVLATELDAPVDFTVSATYDEPVLSWLAFPAQVHGPGRFAVQLSRTDLPVGRHTATVRVRDEWGTVDVALPVVLDVAAPLLSIAPSSLSFEVVATTTLADATGTVTLSAPSDPAAWTASTDVPWLEVVPGAGTAVPGAPTPLTVRVVPSALAALSRGTHLGFVEVNSGDAQGPSSLRVPVAIDLEVPSVTAVGPTVDVEGAQRPTVVLGAGLDTATALLFGDQAATTTSAGNAFAPVNSIVATPPALTAGTYRVVSPTAMGVSFGGATYRVVPACEAAPAAVDAPGRKARIWFDDARCALWEVDFDAGMLARRRAASSWAPEALEIERVSDAAPTADGARLVTWSLAGIRLVDPDTLGFVDGGAYPFSGTALGNRIVSWPDGTIALVWDGALCFSGLDLDPATMTTSWLGPSDCTWSAVAGRAATEFVALTRAPGTPRNLQFWPMHSYQPFVVRPVGADVESLSVDRTGTTVLGVRDGTAAPGESVVCSSVPPEGTRPGKLPSSVAAALLTQDGSRAIAFDGVARTVRMFDLAAPPDASSGLFVEFGTPGGFAPAGDPGANVVLALSGDDRILFVSGDARTIVVPLP